MRKRWTAEEAWTWRTQLGPILGCNFIPSYAVNQIEFWQKANFNGDIIRRELDYAAQLGMNALRVFLHNVVFAVEGDGYLERIDLFLQWASQRGLRIMPVIFDDCWYEGAVPGIQGTPIPGIHNSRWLRSPGLKAARDQVNWVNLEQYVRSLVGHFAQDTRILAWDLYNEVGNFFLPLLSLPAPVRQLRLLLQGLAFYTLPIPTLPLLRKTFDWARSASPIQPLTSPLWFNHPSLNRILMDESDVISFHHYKDAEDLQEYLSRLEEEGRPLLCTEYLARNTGSLFSTCLPVFKAANIGCFNWGLVSGKTQTIYTWSDRKGRNEEPALWYHDILRPDGSPYDEKEIVLLQNYGARNIDKHMG